MRLQIIWITFLSLRRSSELQFWRVWTTLAISCHVALFITLLFFYRLCAWCRPCPNSFDMNLSDRFTSQLAAQWLLDSFWSFMYTSYINHHNMSGKSYEWLVIQAHQETQHRGMEVGLCVIKMETSHGSRVFSNPTTGFSEPFLLLLAVRDSIRMLSLERMMESQIFTRHQHCNPRGWHQIYQMISASMQSICIFLLIDLAEAVGWSISSMWWRAAAKHSAYPLDLYWYGCLVWDLDEVCIRMHIWVYVTNISILYIQ